MIKCHLKAVLKEHNLSQKELCDLINARPSTICDWCNNNIESVKLKLLNDICKALGCEISDILTITQLQPLDFLSRGYFFTQSKIFCILRVTFLYFAWQATFFQLQVIEHKSYILHLHQHLVCLDCLFEYCINILGELQTTLLEYL